MPYWGADYDRKSYKDSKKRRHQAKVAHQTGIIKPIRRNNRKGLIILFSAVFVTVAVGCAMIFLVCSLKSTDSETQQNSGTLNEDLLKVVNIQNRLDNIFVPELSDFNGKKVNAVLLDDLQKMYDDAEQQGINLKINSAYISFDEQEKLYTEEYNELLQSSDYTQVRAEAETQKYIPKAGCSEAQTGMLLDFDLSDEHTRAYVERKCIDFGFILRYSKDKEDLTHHSPSDTLYRYVGCENAVKMRSYGMCLEEYADYVSDK